MKKILKKAYKKILGRIDIILVIIVLVTRIIPNLKIGFLPIFFVALNLFLLVLLMFDVKIFSVSFILLMAIDSMIGTYLFATTNIMGPAMYYWTMFLNLLTMFLVVMNFKKNFPTTSR